MADYKGLTIRIGGDVEPLQRALKAASSAAFATQRDMQSLTRAMKFDGNNFAGLQRSAQLTKNKIEDLATKASELRSAMSQLGKQSTNVGGAKNIQELARNTQNTELAAQKATQRYNELNKMLEINYNAIEKVINKSVPLNKAFDFHDKSSIMSLIDDMNELGVITGNDAHEFEQMVESGQQLEAVNQVLRKIKENSNVLDGVSTGQLDELERLAPLWQKAADEQKAYTQAAKYDKMKTDLTAMNAEIDGLSTKLGQANQNIKFGKVFNDAKVSLQSLDNQTQEVQDDLKRMAEAFAANPSNFEAWKRGMSDLQQLSNNAQAKVELLNKQLGELKNKGADKVAATMGDTATATAKAAEEVTKLTAQYSRAQGEVQKYKTQLDKLEKNGVDKQADEWKQVESALEQAAARVSKYESALDKAKANQQQIAQGAEFKRVEAEAQAATVEVDKVTAAVKAVKTGKASLTEVADGFDKIKEKASAAEKLINAGRSIESMGQSLTGSVTTPIMNAGSQILDASIQMDTAYRDMRKTVDGAETQFRTLKKNAQDFATTHFTSADQILQIEALGGELGVATENLENFATAVSNIDIATNIDAETAATQLGQLSNIMHLNENDYSKFSDSLVRLGNNGASTESQIMDISTRIGAMGTIVGMSAPEILAWSSSIASTGQNSEAAGTAISKTMSQIESAVGAGGDTLKGFADVAGMSAQEFADTWNSNPTEALKRFIEGLKHIEENGGSATNTLEGLGISGVRQKQGLEGLMQTLDGLDDNLRMSKDAWNGVSDEWGAAGDAAREAGKKTEGLSGTMQRAQNMFQNAMSSMGDAVAPAIKNIVDKFQGLYDWFMKLPAGTKRFAAGIAVAAAAFGPLLTGIGKLVKSFGLLQNVGKFATGIGKLKEAFDLVRGGAGTLTEALSATGSGLAGIVSKINPVTVGLAAIAAIVAVAGAAWLDYKAKQEKAAEHQKKLNKAFASTKDIFGGIRGSVDDTADSFENLKEATEEGLDSLAEQNDKAREAMQGISNESVEIDLVTDRIKGLIGKMGGLNDTSKLTAGEVQELKDAFKRYNEVMGTNYGITDNSITKDGEKIKSLEDLNKALEENAEKWKYNSLIRSSQEQEVAYQKEADAAAKRVHESQKAVEAAKAKVKQAQQDFDDFKLKHFGTTEIDPTDTGTLSDKDKSKFVELYEAIGKANDEVEEATITLNENQRAYDTSIDKVGQFGDQQKALAAIQAKFSDSLIKNGVDINQLNSALWEHGVAWDYVDNISTDYFNKALKESGGDVEKLAANLATVTQNASTFASMIQGWDDIGWGIKATGVDVEDLAMKIAEAGVSTDTIRELGAQNFAQLAKNCGGNADKIVGYLQKIQDYNLSDKNIHIDGEGIKLANGALLDLDNMKLGDKKIKVTEQGIEVVGEGLLDIDNCKIGDKEFEVRDNGTITTSKEEIEAIRKAQDGVKTQQSVSYTTNAPQLTQAIGEIGSAQGKVKPTIDANVSSNAPQILPALGKIPETQGQIQPTTQANVETNAWDSVLPFTEILDDQGNIIPVVQADVSTNAGDAAWQVSQVSSAQGKVNPNVKANVSSDAAVATSLYGGLRSAQGLIRAIVAADATSNAQMSTAKFSNLRTEQGRVPRNISANVNSNADETTTAIGGVKQAMQRVNGMVSTVTIVHNTIENVTKKIASIFTGKDATGGVYKPHAAGGVRLHASGGYAIGANPQVLAAGAYNPSVAARLHEVGGTITRSTWYGKHDIVGEAGAEAIVPLTNRRYSDPFVNMIADGIVDRLNQLGTDAATAAQVSALRQELPQLMATYQTKIGGREFTRMVNKYGSMQA